MASTEDPLATRIAHVLRGRRQRLGLSLRGLATRSGVSSSMISAIERAAKSPTIATLAALAAALDVPLAALVDTASPPRLHVTRAGAHAATAAASGGVRRERLGPVLPASRIELLRLAVAPRTLAGPFPAHPGGTLEHVHLVAGRLRVGLGDESVLLEAGDSCAAVADAPHAFDNRDGDVEALLYLVIERP